MNSPSRAVRFVTRRTTMISAAAVVVVLAAAAVWWFGFAAKANAASAASATQNLTVSTRTLQETVSGSGTLAPTVDQEVSFAASGTVTAVKVAAGQTVKKGQTLATVTSTQADADLAEAQATLASAQAKLSDAESASTGTSEEVAAIAADETAVTVAQTAVTAAQAEVSGTTLTAPVAGIVAAVNVAVGDQVTASGSGSSSTSAGGASASSGSDSSATGTAGASSTASGTSSSSTSSGSSAAFEITGTDSWTTSISVSASAMKNIKVGDQVSLSTTENSSFFGTVTSIGLLPSTTSGAATYPVTVDVTGTPKDLYDGVTVTAKVIYKQITDAVAVPSLAISTSNGKSTVQKVVDGKAVTTTVTTGIEEGGYTQILTGLSSGDTVQVTMARPGAGSGSGKTGSSGSTGSTTGGSGFGGPGGSFGSGTGGAPGAGTGQQSGN